MKGKNPSSLRDGIISRLSKIIHNQLFPEEYDFFYDSILDAKERRRGINPMSAEYTEKVNQRRHQLGVSPLDQNGHPIDGSSSKYAERIAQKKIIKADNLMAIYLSEALYQLDPANTCCRENKSFDQYDQIARSVVDSDSDGIPFSSSLPEEMISSFGRDTFHPKTINTLSEKAVESIARLIAGDVVIQNILKEMGSMLQVEHQTINGARGASIYYEKLHQRLDQFGFDGDRPERMYKPKFFRNGENKRD